MRAWNFDGTRQPALHSFTSALWRGLPYFCTYLLYRMQCVLIVGTISAKKLILWVTVCLPLLNPKSSESSISRFAKQNYIPYRPWNCSWSCHFRLLKERRKLGKVYDARYDRGAPLLFWENSPILELKTSLPKSDLEKKQTATGRKAPWLRRYTTRIIYMHKTKILYSFFSWRYWAKQPRPPFRNNFRQKVVYLDASIKARGNTLLLIVLSSTLVVRSLRTKNNDCCRDSCCEKGSTFRRNETVFRDDAAP